MRRKNLVMLLVLVGLYFATSLAMQVMYGQSYGFVEGEDRWRPDGQNGWVKHGNPTEPMPVEPSVQVPLVALYLPILIPGLLLAIFMFTPLRHKLENPIPAKETDDDPDSPEVAPDAQIDSEQ